MGKLVKRFGLAMIGHLSEGGLKIGGKPILCSNFAKCCSLIFLHSIFFQKSRFLKIYDILRCKKDPYNISYDVFHFLKNAIFKHFCYNFGVPSVNKGTTVPCEPLVNHS